MNSRNTVASILQGYAWLNAVCGLVVSVLMMRDRIDGVIIFFVFVAILISSFLIYALGEVIQLLHEIKENTEHSNVLISDELPDL